jgi:hypothetical protein
LHGDALAFAEQREKNERYESKALHDDGKGDGAPLDAAGAFFGLRIAFDQATREQTESLFGRTGHTLDIESHHTPPEKLLRAVGFLRRQPPEVAFRRPAPRSQGCEVLASSVMFDTGGRAKCPSKR